jgi:hypothetical protein
MKDAVQDIYEAVIAIVFGNIVEKSCFTLEKGVKKTKISLMT